MTFSRSPATVWILFANLLKISKSSQEGSYRSAADLQDILGLKTDLVRERGIQIKI